MPAQVLVRELVLLNAKSRHKRGHRHLQLVSNVTLVPTEGKFIMFVGTESFLKGPKTRFTSVTTFLYLMSHSFLDLCCLW